MVWAGVPLEMMLPGIEFQETMDRSLIPDGLEAIPPTQDLRKPIAFLEALHD